jgi:hypothetical protein
MNSSLTVFLTVLGLGVIAWGFERYRTKFVKTDLLLAIAFAVGLLSVAYVPAVYDTLGNILDLQQRFVTISLFANVLLLMTVFYLMTRIRDIRTKISDLTRNLSIKQVPMADGGTERIAVIIPAYNEEGTIDTVVNSLSESIRGYPVEAIIVSDGSADNTANRARKNGTIVVEHPLNQGQGGALKTGFEIASERNAKIVVTMDGDGQHPEDELENLVRPILDDKADFVMGSRYKGYDYSGNGAVRRCGIWTFTWLINRLTKSSITDCTNGFRAICGTAIQDLTLTEERFNAPELIIEARKNGLRIKEIPITIEERQAGETKKPRVGYAVGLARTILIAWLR